MTDFVSDRPTSRQTRQNLPRFLNPTIPSRRRVGLGLGLRFFMDIRDVLRVLRRTRDLPRGRLRPQQRLMLLQQLAHIRFPQ